MVVPPLLVIASVGVVAGVTDKAQSGLTSRAIEGRTLLRNEPKITVNHPYDPYGAPLKVHGRQGKQGQPGPPGPRGKRGRDGPPGPPGLAGKGGEEDALNSFKSKFSKHVPYRLATKNQLVLLVIVNVVVSIAMYFCLVRRTKCVDAQVRPPPSKIDEHEHKAEQDLGAAKKTSPAYLKQDMVDACGLGFGRCQKEKVAGFGEYH